MRLINVHTRRLETFVGSNIPHYAILSHRWERDEIVYQDIVNGNADKIAKSAKVSGCFTRAALDGWDYIWIDSCCIDKSSSAELSESINSMFNWYRSAQVCYVYLNDVPTCEEDPHRSISKFRRSQWFTRGWTLQELLAPSQVEFYDQNWEEIGTKRSLRDLIQSVTGITHLFDYSTASVAQKMSWASKRKTTLLEDHAYCLLGVFNINMPLLYGEGSNAFIRLQVEIINSIEDDSIFAWESTLKCGVLATGPEMFTFSSNIIQHINDPHRLPHSATSKGVRIEASVAQIQPIGQTRRVTALINCARTGGATVEKLALVLYQDENSTSWKRETHLAVVSIPSQGIRSHEKRSTLFVPQIRTMLDEDSTSLFGKYNEFRSHILIEFSSLFQNGFYLSDKLSTTKSVKWHEDGTDWLQVFFQDNNLGPLLLKFQPKDSFQLPEFALIVARKINGTWLGLVYSEAPIDEIEIPLWVESGSLGSDRIAKPFPSDPTTFINAAIRTKRSEGLLHRVVTIELDRTGKLSWQTRKAIEK